MPDTFNTIEIKKKDSLGNKGLWLNYNVNGGYAVILPLHTEDCIHDPCTCGASDAMPLDVVNCRLVWPEIKKG
jgi:hypothetical protein